VGYVGKILGRYFVKNLSGLVTYKKERDFNFEVEEKP